MKTGPLSILRLAPICVALSATALRAEIVPTLFNTGMTSSQIPLPPGAQDPHWLIVDYDPRPGALGIGTNTNFTAPNRPYRTVEFDSAGNFILPFGDHTFNTNWQTNNRDSGWISIRPRYDVGGELDPTGFLTFQTHFSLRGFNPATARIVMWLWSDDNIVSPTGTTGVLLNGAPTSVPPIVRPELPGPPGFDAITAREPQGGPNGFQIRTGFLPGDNTLDLTLLNHFFEAGLRAEIILIAFRPGEDPIPPVINDGKLCNPGKIPGDYIQGPDGTLCFTISGTPPKLPPLFVGRSAYLDGTLCLKLKTCLKGGDNFELIHTQDGVFGEFAAVSLMGSEHAGPLLRFQLVYLENDVLLRILQDSYTLFAFTPNQQAVARALDKLVPDPGADKLIRDLNCTPANQLPDSFDRIDPSDLTSLYLVSFSQTTLMTSEIDQRLGEARRDERGFKTNLPIDHKDGKNFLEAKDNSLSPSPSNPWSIYAMGSGDFADIENTHNAFGFHFATGTATVGADYSPSAWCTGGGSISYSRANIDFRNNGGASIDSGRLALYGSIHGQGLYLNAALGGGYNSFRTKRASFEGIADGNGDSEEIFGYLSTGYEFHKDHFTFGPTASFQTSYVWLNSYREFGSTAPLKIPAQSENSLQSSLGGRVAYETTLAEKPVFTEFRANWQHEYAFQTLPISAQIADTSGPTFTTRGPEIGQDSLVLGATVGIRWSDRCRCHVDYNVQLGRNNYTGQNVALTFERSF